MKGARGFMLAEVLVSTVITLAVLAVAASTFHHAQRMDETATLTADAVQNLRAGINLVARDLVQAGRGIPTGGIPIPSGAGVQPLYRPGPAESYTFDNVTATTLPVLIPGPAMGPVIDGRPTDMISILVADAILPTLTVNSTPPVAGQATLSDDGASLDVGDTVEWMTDVGMGVSIGDLIMFTNALGNAIQTVTAITNGSVVEFGANDVFNFNQRTAPQGSIVQIRSAGSFPQTTAQRVLLLTYYVDNVTTPDVPRLVRRVNAQPAQALAGVVEDLEFSYDLVDGITNPSDLKAPVFPNTANQIRKVNLHIGVRSDRRSSLRQDYMRHHLSTVISIRSLAFVNRYL